MSLTLPTGFQAILEAAVQRPVSVYEIGPAPYSAVELLSNIGFENWTGGDLDDWTDAATGGTITEETTLFHGGASALALTVDAHVRDATLSLSPSKWYHLSCWHRASSTHVAQPLFVLRNNTQSLDLIEDGTWVASNDQVDVAGTTTYVRFSFWFQTPAS